MIIDREWVGSQAENSIYACSVKFTHHSSCDILDSNHPRDHLQTEVMPHQAMLTTYCNQVVARPQI